MFYVTIDPNVVATLIIVGAIYVHCPSHLITKAPAYKAAYGSLTSFLGLANQRFVGSPSPLTTFGLV